MTNNRFISLSLSISLLVLLSLGACSDVSPAFGQYYRGKTLDVSLVTLERVPELRYSMVDTQQLKRHYRLTPSSEDLELVMVRVKVENHLATSAVVNIDSQAAELRGLDNKTTERITARPINVSVNVKEASAPDNPGEASFLGAIWNWFLGVLGIRDQEENTAERIAECPQSNVRNQGRSICFLWNDTSEDGTLKAFNLPKDYGLDGWMVFEAPKDTKFREFRWRAGDSLTIDF